MSVVLKGASFAPAWLTVLDETISFHIDVSSVVRMRLSLKQNFFFKRRTWLMYPTSFPVLWDRPFLALAVFLLQKYKENKLYAKSNKNLLMPSIFLMWQWVTLGNSFLLVKKNKHPKDGYNHIIKIFIKKAVGIPKTITCDVYKRHKRYLP